jgi:hypothetical protein
VQTHRVIAMERVREINVLRLVADDKGHVWAVVVRCREEDAVDTNAQVPL